jgi:predicted regulator of Ras-like GTPase activity (Roadblock/LC7/MglB family)
MIALESYLEEFKGVKGYVASGIMDYTGEILALDSTSPNVKLDVVGAVFNDIFRSAHEASMSIGFEACRNMVLTTPSGVVVMECSGADKAPHLHMIVVLQEGGNQALAKMAIAKVLPLAVKDFS